jgi:ABC-type Fe3+-hydroxamate transport system substrate-binding protein
MEQIVKLLIPAVAALTLSAASISAFALTTGDMYGEPAAADAAYDRTIVVTPQTKYINVTHGEVVNLKIGDKEVAWNFDGVSGQPFDLAKITPDADHKVQVYVESNQPRDGGFGD